MMFDPVTAAVGKFVASITPKGWIVIAAVGLVIAAITAVVLIADNRDKRMIETAQDSGKSEAVIEGQNQTLDQLKEANDAEREVNRRERNAARFDQCLQDSRDAARCERYRPL